MKNLVAVHTVGINERKGLAQVAVAQLGKSKTFHIQRVAAAPQNPIGFELWRSLNGQRFMRQPGAPFRLY